MSDTAAAPSAPVEAPTNATPTQGAPEGQTAQEAAQERQRQRIELAKLADDDEIVMVVDGKEVTVPASKARARWQSGESATQRYQAAAKKAADAEELLSAVASTIRDPRALHRELAAMGMSPRQIAEEFLRLEAEEAALTPEQKRLRELEAEQERLLAERQQEIEERERAEVSRRADVFGRAFLAGMDAAGLKGVPQAVQDDCAWAFKALVEQAQEEGRKLTKAEIAAAMKAAASERARHYSGHLDEDTILSRLTPELVARYQQAQAQQTRTLTPQAPAQPRGDDGRFRAQASNSLDVNGRRVLRGGASFFDR